jgi:hypothetical protein
MEDLIDRTFKVTKSLDAISNDLIYYGKAFYITGNEKTSNELLDIANRIDTLSEEIQAIQSEFIGRLVKESRQSLMDVFSGALGVLQTKETDIS